jgi:hypothetical protein
MGFEQAHNDHVCRVTRASVRGCGDKAKRGPSPGVFEHPRAGHLNLGSIRAWLCQLAVNEMGENKQSIPFLHVTKARPCLV